jgi:hypothetical protein
LLSSIELKAHYLDSSLRVPSFWSLSRKHFGVGLGDGRFVKLNKLRNRLSLKDLRFYCRKLAPMHVYFSRALLNWLRLLILFRVSQSDSFGRQAHIEPERSKTARAISGKSFICFQSYQWANRSGLDGERSNSCL